MNQANIFLYYQTDWFKQKMEKYARQVKLIPKTSLETLQFTTVQSKLAGVVIEIDNNLNEVQEFIINNKLVPNLPIVVVMNNQDWDCIRNCLYTDIDSIIHIDELYLFEVLTFKLFHQAEAKAILEDISINKQYYQHNKIIQQTLSEIENNYLTILKMDQLARLVGFHCSYLTENFKCHKLCKPKDLVFYMKLRHSANLMGIEKYTIEQMSDLSGFNSYHRFKRWITDVFKQSPKQIRQQVVKDGADIFWKTHGPSPFLDR